MKNVYLRFAIFILAFTCPLASFADITHHTESQEVVKQQDSDISNVNLRSQTSNEASSKGSDSKDKVKYKVEVVPYNPNWPKMFEEEAKLLRQKLTANIIDIHHVGSTSVPGLNAKPVIDIIAVVKDAPSTIKALESIGYEYKGEYNIPFHFSFSKKGKPKIHLHMFEADNPEIELNLSFRDYLRTHPEAIKEYAELKAHLLTQESSFEKKNSEFKGYTLGKDAFIRKVLEKVGFNKLRMTHCTHHEEFKMVKNFRKKYFNMMKVSDPDPDFRSLNSPEHVHLMLYKGTKIIGYAYMQMLPKLDAATLRMFVMEDSFDEPFKDQDVQGQFLTLFEKWLKLKNIKYLEITSSQNMYDFYKKYDYKEMQPEEHGLKGNKMDHKEIKMNKMLKV